MSQSSDHGMSQPLGTTSARLVAVKLKGANKNIFRALLNLASANLLIRLMGLVNLVVVVALFGQRGDMDAYNAASALPILMAQLFAGSIEAAVIPVYTRLHTKGAQEQASRLFSTLLNILLIGSVVVTLIMYVFHDPLILISAPGVAASTQHTAFSLAPFIFPILIFMTLNGFMECVLNATGQFGWPAYAGIVAPIICALFVVFGGKTQGIRMLCIGMVAGQIFQLFIILIRAHRAKIVYRPVIDLRMPEIITIGKAAWPVLFGALISQASPLVDQIFSSFIKQEGSIAVMSNAQKITSVPVGVIFVAVGRAVLPYLASYAAIKDMKGFKETLRLYLWAVSIGTLVLTAGMIILAHPIIQIIFQHGAFHADDTSRTAITLIGLVIGLMPMSVGFIVSRAFSALAKTRVLLYTTVFSIFANALFDAIFAHLWGSFGIALATSLVYTCTMFILLITLRLQIGNLHLLTPPREVLQVVWKLGLGQYYINWISWQEENHVYLSHETRKLIARSLLFIVGATAIVIGMVYNDSLTVRIALGMLIILAFFRYHYFLMMCWVLINAFIGSTLPLFNGNNLLSGLTIPTIILLFAIPTKLIFKRMIALPLMLLYVLWVLVGAFVVPTLSLSEFVIVWTTLLAYVAVAVLAIHVVTTRERLMLLIDATMIPSAFVALYGIYGYFTHHGGVVDPTTNFFRISSIFGDVPSTLDLYLSVMIPLVIYRMFTAHGIKRLTYCFLLIIFVIAVGLTFARGPILAIPIGIVVTIVFFPKGRQKAALLWGSIAAAGVGAVAILISNTPILSRFLNQDLGNLNGRTYIWSALIDHFDPTQLFGNGHKASDLLLENLHVGFGRGVIATAAHNIYLETLFDHGLIGVTLLVVALAAVPITLIVKWRTATPDHRLLIATALGIFTSVIIQSYEANDIWNQAVGIYFWIALALPFAMCWSNQTTLKKKLSSEEWEIAEDDIENVETKQLSRV